MKKTKHFIRLQFSTVRTTNFSLIYDGLFDSRQAKTSVRTSTFAKKSKIILLIVVLRLPRVQPGTQTSTILTDVPYRLRTSSVPLLSYLDLMYGHILALHLCQRSSERDSEDKVR